MRVDHRLWVVVADGEHARVLVAGKAPGDYATTYEFTSKDAQRRAGEFGGGAPGRAFESSGSARHAFEPRVDPHLAAKRDFLHWLADWVDQNAGNDAFDRLTLVAPSRCLADLREALGPAARSRLVGVLAKDLVKVPDKDVAGHLTWESLHGEES
jgi:protein required for attachment to host cells